MSKRRITLSPRDRALARVLLGLIEPADMRWPRMSAETKAKACAYIEWASAVYGGRPLRVVHVASLFCLPMSDLRHALDLSPTWDSTHHISPHHN